MRNKIVSVSLVIFFTLIFVQNSYARFRTLEDSSLCYDLYNYDIKVNKDGTYEATTELQIELLKEQARSIVSKYDISYNGDSSFVDIIEAKTMFQGKEYPVSKEMIEDKPIASNQSGFDEKRQISVNFPKPELGAKIYIKYKEIHKKVPIKGLFSTDLYFGVGGYWKKSTVNIKSEIPLLIKKNDPYKNLDIKTSNSNRSDNNSNYLHNATITLRKPLTSGTIGEEQSSGLNHKYYTYISLSSVDSWTPIGSVLEKQYEEVLNQEIPDLFLEIVKLAKKEKGLVAKINRITSSLNEKINYFGSWQSIKGKFIPQDLARSADRQLGDCKDFATITVKILRSLGYKANVALVDRGAGSPEFNSLFPSLGDFNHAILKVIDKDQKIYWIDPTNRVSMADGIFPDIAGKNVLVLDKKSSYEKIPNVLSDSAVTKITKTIKNKNTILYNIKFLGEEALQLSGMGMYMSEQSIQDWLYSTFSSIYVLSKDRLKTNIPDLKSRIVAPINISLEYKNPNMFYKTNKGWGYKFPLSAPWVQTIINVDIKNDIHDLYVGYPKTIERSTIIKNRKISDLDNLNFDLPNQFISLSRKCYIKDNDSVIIDKAVIHDTWISNEDLKSREFAKLRQIILDNHDSSIIIDNN